MMAMEFRKKIKTVIYGCGICQISCPYNKGLSNPMASEINPELAEPELIPFLELTNKSFKETFGMIAGSWRGKNILQRNAIIALANAHDRSAIVKLMEIIDKNNNPIHTATAIWALGEIVKKPDEAMLDFMRSLCPKEEESQKELELVRAKWQF